MWNSPGSKMGDLHKALLPHKKSSPSLQTRRAHSQPTPTPPSPPSNAEGAFLSSNAGNNSLLCWSLVQDFFPVASFSPTLPSSSAAAIGVGVTAIAIAVFSATAPAFVDVPIVGTAVAVFNSDGAVSGRNGDDDLCAFMLLSSKPVFSTPYAFVDGGVCLWTPPRLEAPPAAPKLSMVSMWPLDRCLFSGSSSAQMSESSRACSSVSGLRCPRPLKKIPYVERQGSEGLKTSGLRCLSQFNYNIKWYPQLCHYSFERCGGLHSLAGNIAVAWTGMYVEYLMPYFLRSIHPTTPLLPWT